MTPERKVNLKDRSEFSFRWFAERPAYVNYNNGFVDRTLPVIHNARIGDIACGTGLISSRIFSCYQNAQEEAEIIGIDPNPGALTDARQNVPGTGKVRTWFVEGKAADLVNFVAPNSLDVAYFCNAVHEIPNNEDKLASLVAIHTALKPGRRLFITTAFTTEMFPDRRTFAQWGRLRQRAMEILGKSKDREKTGFGVYSPEYYLTLLNSAGFVTQSVKKEAVEFGSDDIRAISKYDGYIEGQLMDMQDSDKFSLAQKRDALLQAITDDELRLTRIWIEIEVEKSVA